MKKEDLQKDLPVKGELNQPKRQWQTPELQEADYEITSGSGFGILDGASGHGASL